MSKIKGILDLPIVYLIRLLFPQEYLFRGIMFPEIEFDSKMIESIVNKNHFIEFDEEDFLMRMKDKYQFGKYNVSGFYKLCRKRTREEYEEKHRNVCFLLYD